MFVCPERILEGDGSPAVTVAVRASALVLEVTEPSFTLKAIDGALVVWFNCGRNNSRCTCKGLPGLGTPERVRRVPSAKGGDPG